MDAFVQQYWPLFIPFILLNYGLIIYCVIDLFKSQKDKVSKIIWLCVILFVNFLGPIIYLLFGKGE